MEGFGVCWRTNTKAHEGRGEGGGGELAHHDPRALASHTLGILQVHLNDRVDLFQVGLLFGGCARLPAAGQLGEQVRGRESRDFDRGSSSGGGDGLCSCRSSRGSSSTSRFRSTLGLFQDTIEFLLAEVTPG